jgi:hypothetical protein
MQERKHPSQIVEMDVDYFAVLGIDRTKFPEGKNTQERKIIADILCNSYHKLARLYHPDMPNGSPEAFSALIRAHTVLGDSILRQYYLYGNSIKMVEDHAVQIDWSSTGTYESGTLQDTIGFSLFFKICDKKDELDLVPAFRPSTELDSYEWDFLLKNTEHLDNEKQFKLCLSLVYDEDTVLKLTSGEQIEKSLPFKIYLCIPRASLYFLRGENERFYYKDGSFDELKGRIYRSEFSDYDLHQSCLLENAQKYIEEQLPIDLAKFRSGELIAEKQKRDIEAGQASWLSTNQLKDVDRDILRSILRMKSFAVVEAGDDADKFLDNLPNSTNEKAEKVGTKSSKKKLISKNL